MNRILSLSTTQFNYFNIAKASVTALALSILSCRKIPAIQRCAKQRAFTSFQRGFIGFALTTVYFVATSRFFFPLTQKVSVQRRRTDKASQSSDSKAALSLKNRLALRGCEQAIRRNGVSFVSSTSLLNRRVIFICLDISTLEKKQRALKWCQLFLQGKKAVSSPLRQMEQIEEIKAHLPCPDPKMTVTPAEYNRKTHGVNGFLMKQKLFTALFDAYIDLLNTEFKMKPEETLKELEKKNYFSRSSQEQALMWTLRYLTGSSSEPSIFGKLLSHTGLTVSKEEARYRGFIEAHRKLIATYQGKQDADQDEIVQWGRVLAYVRMVPSIQAYQESLVQAHYKALPDMTAQTFHQAFSLRNEAFRRADPQMKLWKLWSETAKLKGATSFCDYFGVNPPNLRKVETWKKRDDKRQIFYLRHSTPHAGATFTVAPIDSTYREFLSYTEKKNQGVLYAVHQRYRDFGMKFEQEGYRVQSIVDLEKDHPNLLVLIQSVESQLFKKGAKTFTALKEAIIGSFKQKEQACGNRLPHFLTIDKGKSLAIQSKYEAKLRDIFDTVQRLFFPGKGDQIDQTPIDVYGNPKEEKHYTNKSQAFIMLFYHFQREHLKHADLTKYGYQFDVKYINTGCKDDYDRGLGQNLTSDRVHHHQVHGANIPTEDLEASLSSGQAPPIQGKGVPVIRYRVHPALFVSSILANLGKDKLRELRNMEWNGWSLTGYCVERRPGQTAV